MKISSATAANRARGRPPACAWRGRNAASRKAISCISGSTSDACPAALGGRIGQLSLRLRRALPECLDMPAPDLQNNGLFHRLFDERRDTQAANGGRL